MKSPPEARSLTLEITSSELFNFSNLLQCSYNFKNSLKIKADLKMLFNLYLRPGFLQLLLYSSRFILVDTFLDRLRSTLYQIFSLFKPQSGHLPHRLDHVDFILADFLKDYAELRLFLLGCCPCWCPCNWCRSHCHWCRSHPELILQCFH